MLGDAQYCHDPQARVAGVLQKGLGNDTLCTEHHATPSAVRSPQMPRTHRSCALARVSQAATALDGCVGTALALCVHSAKLPPKHRPIPTIDGRR
mmetsp:Transcript_57342/g.94279  ORF Transcript_57342/g.94279 Transcript_57342/m.94279 type:complete len:95 (+) Transcript_57342:119-403(+)